MWTAASTVGDQSEDALLLTPSSLPPLFARWSVELPAAAQATSSSSISSNGALRREYMGKGGDHAHRVQQYRAVACA
ncbi:hypothetical protein STCU_10507 [Strigomonas culicis]|uniref:Uncharacterized protein n=1 Tax=Strigomonas culicis TaxID=28005 RepID=S9TLE7_9TRYP|nr:hypothetical protein STCU_10507 [Strigomonas culicis]|eukprot:EPY17614.1 hypothetical protein STCU_10507 [Strigomonas culicis]